MTNYTLKPIGGTDGFIIYNIISYMQCKGIKGDTYYEEVSSGYHVFTGRSSLYFTENLPDAYAFIIRQLAAPETPHGNLSANSASV